MTLVILLGPDPHRPGSSLLLALALSLTFLAGCIGGNPSSLGSGPTVTFTKTTGAIEGIVTDDEIVPLIGARMALEGVGKTTTDLGGWFAFSNLEPGRYNVSVEAIAHVAAFQWVDVASEEIVTVRFALPPVNLEYRWVKQYVYEGNLTVGTPQGRGTANGVDRQAYKIPVLDKTDAGEFAYCTEISIRLLSYTPTSVDVDIYLINGTGQQISAGATGSKNELISYVKPLPPQNLTLIVHFWAGAASHFRVYVNESYSTGVAAQLLRYQKT